MVEYDRLWDWSVDGSIESSKQGRMVGRIEDYRRIPDVPVNDCFLYVGETTPGSKYVHDTFYRHIGEGNVEKINLDGRDDDARALIASLTERMGTVETVADSTATSLATTQGEVVGTQARVSGLEDRATAAETEIENLKVGKEDVFMPVHPLKLEDGQFSVNYTGDAGISVADGVISISRWLPDPVALNKTTISASLWTGMEGGGYKYIVPVPQAKRVGKMITFLPDSPDAEETVARCWVTPAGTIGEGDMALYAKERPTSDFSAFFLVSDIDSTMYSVAVNASNGHVASSVDNAQCEPVEGRAIKGLVDGKQDKLTQANAGTNVTITTVDGVVKINAAGGSGGEGKQYVGDEGIVVDNDSDPGVIKLTPTVQTTLAQVAHKAEEFTVDTSASPLTFTDRILSIASDKCSPKASVLDFVISTGDWNITSSSIYARKSGIGFTANGCVMFVSGLSKDDDTMLVEDDVRVSVYRDSVDTLEFIASRKPTNNITIRLVKFYSTSETASTVVNCFTGVSTDLSAPGAVSGKAMSEYVASTYQTALTEANAGENVTITKVDGVLKINAQASQGESYQSGDGIEFTPVEGQPTIISVKQDVLDEVAKVAGKAEDFTVDTETAPFVFGDNRKLTVRPDDVSPKSYLVYWDIIANNWHPDPLKEGDWIASSLDDTSGQGKDIKLSKTGYHIQVSGYKELDNLCAMNSSITVEINELNGSITARTSVAPPDVMITLRVAVWYLRSDIESAVTYAYTVYQFVKNLDQQMRAYVDGKFQPILTQANAGANIYITTTSEGVVQINSTGGGGGGTSYQPGYGITIDPPTTEGSLPVIRASDALVNDIASYQTKVYYWDIVTSDWEATADNEWIASRYEFGIPETGALVNVSGDTDASNSLAQLSYLKLSVLSNRNTLRATAKLKPTGTITLKLLVGRIDPTTSTMFNYQWAGGVSKLQENLNAPINSGTVFTAVAGKENKLTDANEGRGIDISRDPATGEVTIACTVTGTDIVQGDGIIIEDVAVEENATSKRIRVDDDYIKSIAGSATVASWQIAVSQWESDAGKYVYRATRTGYTATGYHLVMYTTFEASERIAVDLGLKAEISNSDGGTLTIRVDSQPSEILRVKALVSKIGNNDDSVIEYSWNRGTSAVNDLATPVSSSAVKTALESKENTLVAGEGIVLNRDTPGKTVISSDGMTYESGSASVVVNNELGTIGLTDSAEEVLSGAATRAKVLPWSILSTQWSYDDRDSVWKATMDGSTLLAEYGQSIYVIGASRADIETIQEYGITLGDVVSGSTLGTCKITATATRDLKTDGVNVLVGLVISSISSDAHTIVINDVVAAKESTAGLSGTASPVSEQTIKTELGKYQLFLTEDNIHDESKENLSIVNVEGVPKIRFNGAGESVKMITGIATLPRSAWNEADKSAHLSLPSAMMEGQVIQLSPFAAEDSMVCVQRGVRATIVEIITIEDRQDHGIRMLCDVLPEAENIKFRYIVMPATTPNSVTVMDTSIVSDSLEDAGKAPVAGSTLLTEFAKYQKTIEPTEGGGITLAENPSVPGKYLIGLTNPIQYYTGKTGEINVSEGEVTHEISLSDAVKTNIEGRMPKFTWGTNLSYDEDTKTVSATDTLYTADGTTLNLADNKFSLTEDYVNAIAGKLTGTKVTEISKDKGDNEFAPAKTIATYVESLISSSIKFMGSCTNAELATKDKILGHVWRISDEGTWPMGAMVICDQEPAPPDVEGRWVKFGENVDYSVFEQNANKVDAVEEGKTSHDYYPSMVCLTTELGKKVNVVKDGDRELVLSHNDYTDDEKTKLGNIAAGAQVNVIETVKVDGTALEIADKAVNIDMATILEPYATEEYVDTGLSNKVDKVLDEATGKYLVLSHNDYTTDDMNKLAGIAAGADVSPFQKMYINTDMEAVFTTKENVKVLDMVYDSPVEAEGDKPTVLITKSQADGTNYVHFNLNPVVLEPYMKTSEADTKYQIQLVAGEGIHIDYEKYPGKAEISATYVPPTLEGANGIVIRDGIIMLDDAIFTVPGDAPTPVPGQFVGANGVVVDGTEIKLDPNVFGFSDGLTSRNITAGTYSGSNGIEVVGNTVQLNHLIFGFVASLFSAPNYKSFVLDKDNWYEDDDWYVQDVMCNGCVADEPYFIIGMYDNGKRVRRDFYIQKVGNGSITIETHVRPTKNLVARLMLPYGGEN